jgi:hypothetical protein
MLLALILKASLMTKVSPPEFNSIFRLMIDIIEMR